MHDRTVFLGEALESILDQDYIGAVEIIVIDDGSVEPIAPAFESRFPTVQFVRQANQGIAITRDDGARMGSGQLIAYLDDDDRWPIDSLRRRVDVLLDHPVLNVVCGETTLFWPGHGPEQPYYAGRFPRLLDAAHTVDGTVRIYGHGALLAMVLLSVPFYAQTLLARRAWFLEVGGWGRDASIYAECFDFWYRATTDGPIGFLTDPVVEVRRGHDQATADIPGSRLLESEELVRWSRRVAEEDRRRIAPRLVRRFVSRTVFNLRHASLDAARHQAWCAARVGVLDPIRRLFRR